MRYLWTGLVVAACAPPPSYSMVGIARDERTLWVAMVENRGAPGAARFMVGVCDASASGVEGSSCHWSEISPPGSSAIGVSRDTSGRLTTALQSAALRAATLGNEGCSDVSVADVDHGAGSPGYWISACGARQLWRWVPSERRFTNQTPADQSITQTP